MTDSLDEYPTRLGKPVRQWSAGIAAACALHFAVYFGGSWVTGLVERAGHYHQTFSPNPVGLLGAVVCFTLAVGIGVWKRPRIVEWCVPFLVFVGYWFLAAVLLNISHHDFPDDGELAMFAPAMFVSCFFITIAPLALKGLLSLRHVNDGKERTH